MDYYNYTSKFNQIIEHQETIIENQENLNNLLTGINNLIGIIVFVIILKMVVSIVRGCL